MDTVLASPGDVRDLPVQEVTLLSGPASAGTSDAQLTGGLAVSAVPSSSPSQERLVRIAAMIREAERAMPSADRRERRGKRSGPIPLTPRRLHRAAARPRAGWPETAELAC